MSETKGFGTVRRTERDERIYPSKMDSSIGDGKPITANVVGKPKNTMNENVLNALQATLASANTLNQSLQGLTEAITAENDAQKAKPSATSVAHTTAATSPKAKRKARKSRKAATTAKQTTKATAKQSTKKVAAKDFVFPSSLYVTAKPVSYTHLTLPTTSRV